MRLDDALAWLRSRSIKCEQIVVKVAEKNTLAPSNFPRSSCVLVLFSFLPFLLIVACLRRKSCCLHLTIIGINSTNVFLFQISLISAIVFTCLSWWRPCISMFTHPFFSFSSCALSRTVRRERSRTRSRIFSLQAFSCTVCNVRVLFNEWEKDGIIPAWMEHWCRCCVTTAIRPWMRRTSVVFLWCFDSSMNQKEVSDRQSSASSFLSRRKIIRFAANKTEQIDWSKRSARRQRENFAQKYLISRRHSFILSSPSFSFRTITSTVTCAIIVHSFLQVQSFIVVAASLITQNRIVILQRYPWMHRRRSTAVWAATAMVVIVTQWKKFILRPVLCLHTLLTVRSPH